MIHIVIGNDFNISLSLLSNPVPLYISIYCIMLVNSEIKYCLNYKFKKIPSIAQSGCGREKSLKSRQTKSNNSSKTNDIRMKLWLRTGKSIEI